MPLDFMARADPCLPWPGPGPMKAEQQGEVKGLNQEPLEVWGEEEGRGQSGREAGRVGGAPSWLGAARSLWPKVFPRLSRSLGLAQASVLPKAPRTLLRCSVAETHGRSLGLRG